MTVIMSPSQFRRLGIISSFVRLDSNGKPIPMPWEQYVYKIIRISQEDNICLLLDEQGIHWLEMTTSECRTLIHSLQEAVSYLEEKINPPGSGKMICVKCKKHWRAKNKQWEFAPGEVTVNHKLHKIIHNADNGTITEI